MQISGFHGICRSFEFMKRNDEIEHGGMGFYSNTNNSIESIGMELNFNRIVWWIMSRTFQIVVVAIVIIRWICSGHWTVDRGHTMSSLFGILFTFYLDVLNPGCFVVLSTLRCEWSEIVNVVFIDAFGFSCDATWTLRNQTNDNREQQSVLPNNDNLQFYLWSMPFIWTNKMCSSQSEMKR